MRRGHSWAPCHSQGLLPCVPFLPRVPASPWAPCQDTTPLSHISGVCCGFLCSPHMPLPKHLCCHCKNQCCFSFLPSLFNCFTSATTSSSSMYFLTWSNVSQTTPRNHCHSREAQCSWKGACKPTVIFFPNCNFSDSSLVPHCSAQPLCGFLPTLEQSQFTAQIFRPPKPLGK